MGEGGGSVKGLRARPWRRRIRPLFPLCVEQRRICCDIAAMSQQRGITVTLESRLLGAAVISPSSPRAALRPLRFGGCVVGFSPFLPVTFTGD